MFQKNYSTNEDFDIENEKTFFRLKLVFKCIL